jgi:hypothetical protein
MNGRLAYSSPVALSESPLAGILSLSTGDTLYARVTEAQWSTSRVRVSLLAEDPEDEGIMDSIREPSRSYVVAYRRNVALCDLVDNTQIFRDQHRIWTLEFGIKRTDFIPSLEMSFASTSADKLAELRARRLLLNENPARESSDINDITRELFLGGQQTLIRIERSIFPVLHQKFGSNPEKFVQIAWIGAVMSLKLGGCVVEINQLSLALRERALDVKFRGRRAARFVNHPAYEIFIEGTCAL